jgi:hypothetical protein
MVTGGCGPLDDPLAPQRRQVRILCPVVEALVLAMLDIQAHPGPGSAIRTGLVGDHHARRAGSIADEPAQRRFQRTAPDAVKRAISMG